MDESLLFGEFPFSATESGEKAKELAKALKVGYEMGTTDQTGFGAIRHESLESTLKIVEADENSPKLWKACKKGKASGPVEEFALLNELGGAGSYSEGGLPEEYDEDLSRDFEQVKLIGAVGQVSYFAKSASMLKEAEALQTKMKTIAMLKYADIQLVNGDASLIPTEWNGIWAQFNKRVKNPTQNIIDLRGKRLKPETFNQAGLIIAENYGNANNLQAWFGQDAYANYTEQLIASKQWFVGQNVNGVNVSPDNWKLAHSAGKIETDIFMRHKGESYTGAPHPKLNKAGNAFAASNKSAPNQLNSSTCTAVSEEDTTGLDYLAAATYDYAIVAVNKYGCAAAFEVKGVTNLAGNRVSFTISDNGSAPGFEATKFDIYRKLASNTDLKAYQYVRSFAEAATSKKDDGYYIPGTTRGFICEWNPDQVWRFDQLLPMLKMDLATISDSKRWLQKIYGTPKVFNANKMVWVENIGSTAW